MSEYKTIDINQMSNEELAIYYQETKSEEALARLCTKNQKFLYKCVQSYNANTYTGYRVVDTEDVIQAGYMAIIIAAKKFDASVGTSFLTYAGNWIKREIGLLKSETFYAVKIPPTVSALIARYGYQIEQLSRETELSNEEILKKVAKNNDTTIDDVKRHVDFQNMWMRKTSIDKPLYPDSYCRETIADAYIDKNAEVDHSEVSKMLVEQILEKTVFKKGEKKKAENERIREMVLDRYGIGGRKALTLEEMGVKYNLTRERCRQIVDKALVEMAKSAKRLDITPDTMVD